MKRIRKEIVVFSLCMMLAAGTVNFAEEVPFVFEETEEICIQMEEAQKEEEIIPFENDDSVDETPEDVHEAGNDMDEPEEKPEEAKEEEALFSDAANEGFSDDEVQTIHMDLYVDVPSYLYSRDRVFFLRIVSDNRGYSVPIYVPEEGGRIRKSLEVEADEYRVYLMQTLDARVAAVEAPEILFISEGMPGVYGNAGGLSKAKGTVCGFVLERTQIIPPVSTDFAGREIDG